jgi:U4/U6 small nuclear ribonucleoprotein PRP31
MSTLADELLNDFEDSGDENEDRGLQDDDQANGTNGHSYDHDNVGSPVGAENDETMEDVEEDEDVAREDMMEDEDETKAKVEKMHLGAVRDVRSVAGLMKILQPVLDVSPPTPVSAPLWFTSVWSSPDSMPQP